MCHAEPVENYQKSIHGQLQASGNPDAPYCSDCHETHAEQRKVETASPTFARNIPDLCGRCHREGEKAAVANTGDQTEIVQKYTMSIHGKGLLESGLLVTATCVDCHSVHAELPASDPLSTVHPENVASTCARCHHGIYEDFSISIHGKEVSDTDKELPVCSSCHLSHTIKRVDLSDFRSEIIDQCGSCHADVTESYFETFHGKVSKLGSDLVAKCSDCHGSHNILPTSNPASTLSRQNVVETCRTCHPNSNRKFVGYLTHATHHDRDKFPYLFYTYWFMASLLIGVFTFFGIHTALWLPRALSERRKLRLEAPPDLKGAFHERFDSFSRFLHLLVITSFLTLALTGMTIKFADVGIFQFISRLMGGYEVTGFVHRLAAIVTFAYFGLHVGYLVRKRKRRRLSLKRLLTGERTLMFRLQDFKEFIATYKWFVGLGPRPSYGRWTYWEKFDYFAVFWGVAIIGASGLILWFPEFFTNLGIPGWLINVSSIIHSDEALLATGFIFTIHFFNTHFRPDKFPMDPVIFTGRVPLEELKYDRPREYSRLVKRQGFEKNLVGAPPAWLEKAARIFGFTALGIGLLIIVLIIYSAVFAYQ
jgi:cytochrome b subunit of formate dehydrogenase